MLTHHHVSSEVSSFPELSILRSQGIALCRLHLLRRWLEPMCRSVRILWDWHPALIRNLQVMKSQAHPFGEPQWIITALNTCSFWPRFNSGCWIYLGFPLSDMTVSTSGSGGRCFLFMGAHSTQLLSQKISDRQVSVTEISPSLAMTAFGPCFQPLYYRQIMEAFLISLCFPSDSKMFAHTSWHLQRV